MIVTLPIYLLVSPSPLWLGLPVADWLRWIGVALGVLSLPFLAWVHYTLDKHWDISITKKRSHTRNKRTISTDSTSDVHRPHRVLPCLGIGLRQLTPAHQLPSNDSAHHTANPQRRANAAEEIRRRISSLHETDWTAAASF